MLSEFDQRSKRLNVLLSVVCVVIGILLFFSIYFAETRVCTKNARSRADSVAHYVESQCLTYDSVSAEEEVKSLIRVTDLTQEVRRSFFSVPSRSAADFDSELVDYLENTRLTGILVTDDRSGETRSYFSDGEAHPDMPAALADYANRFGEEKTQYNKSYSERIVTGDRCVDYAVVARKDAPGLLLCFLCQKTSDVVGTRLSVQTLLNGYSFTGGGITVVTDGINVLGSNDTELNDMLVSDRALILKTRKAETFDSLITIEEEGSRYFAFRIKSKNYFIYVFNPYKEVFKDRTIFLSYAMVVYCLFWLVLLVVKSRMTRVKDEERHRQDEEYRKNMERLADEAIRANNVKADFLRRMSHDIRTPINGIRGILDIADYYADDLGKQQECRDKVRKSSGYLLELVNDVLDMSKMDYAELQQRIEPYNISSVLSDVETIVKPQAAERGVTVSFFKNIRHPEVVGSPVLFKRMLMNLVTNAIKYNKENGSVVVDCAETGFDGKKASFVLKVKDTGIGMSEEFQKKMYEPFAQEDNTCKSSFEGTGLGLAIVKKITDATGAKIECQSAQGEGTTFTVTLRLPAAESPADENIAPAGAKSLAGQKILLAEDNELNAEITKFVLEIDGALVTVCKNGRDAVDTFASSAPGEYAAILMDVMMPIMDGLQATRAIRALPRPDAKTVPVIAMTANAYQDDVIRAKEVGMNEHLAKPVDSKKLAETVLQLIVRKGE